MADGWRAFCRAQPCFAFVGERFESVPALRQARSLLLDLFGGQQVAAVNLKGLDHVMLAVAVSDTKLLLRQYSIRLKKSGTKVLPRHCRP